MKYYVWDGAAEHGPYTKPQLESLYRSGSVTSGASARSEFENEWKTVGVLFSTPHEGRAVPPVDYLKSLRERTCYKGLRSAIDFTAILLIIILALGALGALMGSLGEGDMRLLLVALIVAPIQIAIVLFSKQASHAAIDLVDATLDRNARGQ